MRATGRVSMRVARGRANGMIGQTIMRKRGRGNGGNVNKSSEKPLYFVAFVWLLFFNLKEVENNVQK